MVNFGCPIVVRHDTRGSLGHLILGRVGLPTLVKEIIFRDLEEAVLEKENPFMTPGLKDSFLTRD